MSNGIENMFDSGFEAIQGFGEKIGDARYKDNAIKTKEDEEIYLRTIRPLELKKIQEAYPDMDATEQAALAEQAAQSALEDRKKESLNLFGQLTTPKSLAAGAGILASILAARQSQKRYDDYMATRPKYDPGQNPYMAQGGGIQAFAEGTKPIGQKTLSEMMIMNLKEKPMSFLMKSMAAGYAPSDLMDIMSIFGMRDGGGIQSFKFGGTDGSAEQFPYDQAKKFTGTVKGPGDGQSDDIPAFLSNDEHVVTKQEVETIGKMLGGDVDTGHEALYAMRGGIKKLGDKMGVSYT